MSFVGSPGFITPNVVDTNTNTHQKTLAWTFTAPASGAGIYEFTIPGAPDGTNTTWNVREVNIRASVPSSGTTTFQIETSSGAGVFSGSNILTSALTLSGAAVYEASTTSFAITTLDTNDKVRINFTAVDPTHDGIVITMELGT